MKRIVVALLGATALSLGVSAGVATAQDDECSPGVVLEHSVRLVDRADSGTHGNTWARDFFTRTTMITNNCDGTFDVKVTDSGRFDPVADEASPGAGTPMTRPFNPDYGRSLNGGATYVVESDVAPTSPDDGVDVQAQSTGKWPALFFDGNAGTMLDWGWTYRYCGETWVNAKTGNHGDVTGLHCVKPKLHLTVDAVNCVPAGDGTGGTGGNTDGARAAAATLKVKVVGPVPHAKTSVDYSASDGQEGELKLGFTARQAKTALDFPEDAGDGEVVVTLGHGRWAKTATVKTDCVTPPPPSSTSPSTSPSTPPSSVLDTTSGVPVTTTPVHYENCDDVIAAGKAPIHADTAGFRAVFDVDGNGIGCELSERVQQVSTDRDLASTGASGVGALVGIGTLLVVGGAVVTATAIRRRRSTSSVGGVDGR